jgi:hypothetical protein
LFIQNKKACAILRSAIACQKQRGTEEPALWPSPTGSPLILLQLRCSLCSPPPPSCSPWHTLLLGRRHYFALPRALVILVILFTTQRETEAREKGPRGYQLWW